FEKLHAGTLSRYKVTGENKWSESTLESVKRGSVIQGSGRTGVLVKHPLIVESVKTTLQAIRAAKAPLTVSIVRALMRAEIEEEAPELLEKGLKISEKFIRSFLSSVMDWTPQTATRAAHHIP
ncbi:hypothetical protein GGX14DRAFT_309100, partial [Mycena pura]